MCQLQDSWFRTFQSRVSGSPPQAENPITLSSLTNDRLQVLLADRNLLRPLLTRRTSFSLISKLEFAGDVEHGGRERCEEWAGPRHPGAKLSPDVRDRVSKFGTTTSLQPPHSASKTRTKKLFLFSWTVFDASSPVSSASFIECDNRNLRSFRIHYDCNAWKRSPLCWNTNSAEKLRTNKRRNNNRNITENKSDKLGATLHVRSINLRKLVLCSESCWSSFGRGAPRIGRCAPQ